jgi:hypothetical protein
MSYGLPRRHLGYLSDGANEAGDDEKRDENFEKEETSHQERVEHWHKSPDALWVKAVDACLKNERNSVSLKMNTEKSCLNLFEIFHASLSNRNP